MLYHCVVQCHPLAFTVCIGVLCCIIVLYSATL